MATWQDQALNKKSVCSGTVYLLCIDICIYNMTHIIDFMYRHIHVNYILLLIFICLSVNAFLTVHGCCQVDSNLLFFQCRIGTMIPTLCAMRAPLGRDMLLGGLSALR